MKKSALVLATLAVALLSLTGTSIAAPWAVPGGACTQEGANANSNGFLTCTGGVWVSNAVLMGTTAATCDSTNAGYIRYNSGQFEGCNGTGWIQLAGGGVPTYLGVTPTTYTGNLGGYTGANAKCVTGFGTGARMMTVEDSKKIGRTTNYPGNGWIDCEESMFIKADDSTWRCGPASSGTPSAFNCGSYTSTSYTGTNISETGVLGQQSCGGSIGIHCVKD